MNAEEIREALRKRFNDHRRYAIGEEVGITTGGWCRRLDMIVVDCFESNGFRIDGIEIKISTSDLRRELENPDKHITFFDVLDFYTLAVPVGIVEPVIEAIPKKWGILIVNEDGTTRYRRKPLALRDERFNKPVPRGFFASFVRNIQEFQPSEQELKKAYEKGREDEKSHYDYTREYVLRERKKIDDYEHLMNRFGIYKDVDKAMDEFERFRKLPLARLSYLTEEAIESLNNLSDYIKQEREAPTVIEATEGRKK